MSNFWPPHHLGGYELRSREVVSGLRTAGYEVRVLTGRYRAQGATGAVCATGGLPASDSTGETPVPQFSSRADPWVTRSLHLRWGPPYPPEDLPGMLRCEAADRRTLRSVLTEFRPDVVDVWGMEFASQASVSELIATGLPVHVTVEDTWLLDGFARDPLCIVTETARRLDVPMTPGLRRLCCLGHARPGLGDAAVCFVSQALRDRHREAGFDYARCRVRVAGLEMSAFREATSPPPPPPFVIASVGQLTASRGQADLIAAAARVAGKPDCPWPIVVRIIGGGGTAYVTELKALACESASDQFRVEFLGLRKPDRAAEFYAGAHLFVFTSRLPEGLPRVLMEAMAAGVPIIATDTGGQCDILDGGRWGKLVPPGDQAALVGAIREAMAGLPRWQSRAVEARRHALDAFDMEAYTAAHARDLSEVANRSRPPTPEVTIDADLPEQGEIDCFSSALGDAVEVDAGAFDVAGDPEGAWQLGVVLKRAGRLPAADRLFAELLRVAPDDATHVRRATFHLAELAMIREAWSQAIGLLERCLAAAPDHTKAAFDLQQACQRRLPDHLSGLAG
ncbi:MAG: glycosyltransferase [Planctomycetota bacterium]